MVRSILSMIIISFLLNACGTKGMLYLPEREYPLPAQAPAEKAPADASKK
jgi:predicted small lipoprotein YifL